MKTRQGLVVPFLCALLTATSMGSLAENGPLAEGPEPGLSHGTGASILPHALPRIRAPRDDRRRRGVQPGLGAARTQPPPAGQLPRESVDGSALAAAPAGAAPTLGSNFEGIGFTGFFPSDNAVAAGPNHVVQAVNESLRISTKTGTTLSTSTFASWWSPVVSGVGPFDPKILYDQHSDRWVLLTVARDVAHQRAWYLISTSKTADPTQEWCVWALDATLDGTTPSTNWADYPQLGVDDEAFYVTSNQFSFGPDFSQYAKLRIMAKSQFYDNTCGPIAWTDVWNMQEANGVPAFTLQPAHTFGTPGKEYLVSANSILGADVTLWSVTNSATSPLFTREATVPVGAYTAPPEAQQMGSFTALDTGDARLLNAVYRNGSLYTTHTVACNGLFACARYFQISIAGPTVALDESFGAFGFYYFYPAIMPDPSGNIVTVFNRSSATEFVGIRYTGRRTTDSGFEASASLQGGAAPHVLVDSSGRNRWGDYSGIALDPADPTQVWMSGALAIAPSTTWGTWVGEVDATSGTSPGPCPASTALQGAPEGPATLATLRRLRAEVLTGSSDGRRLIAAFNQHRWEGSRLLLQDAVLRTQARAILSRLLPKIQALVDGRDPALGPSDVAAIDRFLEVVSVQASPRLKRTITVLRSDLQRGTLLLHFRPAGSGGQSTSQPAVR